MKIIRSSILDYIPSLTLPLSHLIYCFYLFCRYTK